MKEDLAKMILYLSAFILGILDVIFVIFSAIFLCLILTGVILGTKVFIILLFVMIGLNVLFLIYIPIYLKIRKD
jgi:hypothetical protein